MSGPITITDQEFALFQRMIYKIAGICLSEQKKVLLLGRLTRRLEHHGLNSFSQYYRMLNSGEHPDELQVMVDLLTTNETYFFREIKHFEFLRKEILPVCKTSSPFRIWSAASSSGEEIYSLAMDLAEHLPNTPWEILGSDISTRMLKKAAAGHYPLTRIDGIPTEYLKKYCLKGVRSHEGTFLINPELRKKTQFLQINLTHPITANIGVFDVIFLRNVMIYFDTETKAKVVSNLLPRLKSGGHLIIGHSETLNGVSDQVEVVRPTIYRKP